MLRTIGRIFLLLVLGLAGTIAIFTVSVQIVNSAVPVNLPVGPHVYTSLWDERYVSASGTWVIDNDRHAFPLNTSEITCRRPDSFCTATTARIDYNTLTLESERSPKANRQEECSEMTR